MTEPLRPITRPWNKLSVEAAEIDIEEFEFLLSVGESMESALVRLDLHARSMTRRYQLLGRPVPDGLWLLASRRKPRAVAS